MKAAQDLVPLWSTMEHKSYNRLPIVTEKKTYDNRIWRPLPISGTHHSIDHLWRARFIVMKLVRFHADTNVFTRFDVVALRHGRVEQLERRHAFYIWVPEKLLLFRITVK